MHKTSIPNRQPPACLFFTLVSVVQGTGCEEHGHPCTELVYTGVSRGVLHDGGRQWNYGPQTVFGYQPGTTHWVRNTASGTHLCLGVRGGGAELLGVGPLAHSPSVIERFNQLDAATRSPDSTREFRLNLLAGLIVLDLLDAGASPVPKEKIEHGPAAMARMLIEERFKKPLLISDLADSVYISPEHLRRVFRETFGTSPMHYLIRRRIEHACDLLRSTDTPVHEIGEMSGIDDPYYFSRLFKRITGMTPTAYRAAKT